MNPTVASTARSGGRNALNRLSTLSLLAQAGRALYRGNRKLAALLAGAAVLARKWSGVSYVVQGALALYRLFKRRR